MLGKTADTTKCEEQFATAITKADEATAKKMASCRWLDNADGTATGCFADHCDWRLPTLGEPRSIMDAQSPGCTLNPCTTIPGFTRSGFR